MSTILERLREALADTYTVEAEIGRGGMATVFRAEDRKHQRKVAIKVLHPELATAVGAQRFLNEIEIAASLEHPHILTLIDSGQAHELLYFVMPFIDGESLRDRLARETQLSIEEAVRITVEIADGLEYAHEHGVVHRDVKPGNILLSGKHAVLTDFGIARAVTLARDQHLTGTGHTLGTPLYASPEQASASETVDGRSDIYSLGCVLYEMLSGDAPLGGPTPQAIEKRRISETPALLHPVRKSVTPLLDTVLSKALALVPADRFDTAEAFGTALMVASMDSTPVASLDLASTPALQALSPRRPSIRFSRWMLAAAPVAALAFVGAWQLAAWQLDEARTTVGPSPAAVAMRAERLTTDGRVLRASMSPDGLSFAYSAAEQGGGTRIVVGQLDGERRERTLAVVEQVHLGLDWKPDGSAVTFLARYLGRRNRLAVSPNGGAVRAVSPPATATFSPVDMRCLYRDPRSHYIVVDTLCHRRPTTPNPDTTVTPYPAGLDSILVRGDFEQIVDAAFSIRGDYLLVTVRQGASVAIHAVSLTDDDQRIVGAEGVESGSLFWRLDGRVLYYVRALASGPELMRQATTPTGEPIGEPESLLSLGDSLTIVSISPDGHRLLATKEETADRIVRVWPDGTEILRVDSIPGSENGYLIRHSPDGKWLGFLRDGAAGADLYRLPIEGGRPQRITTVGNVLDFAWSAGSDMVAFTAPWQDTTRVWFVSAEGGPPALLAGSHTSRSGEVSWSPGPILYQKPLNSNYVIVDSLRLRFQNQWQPLTAAGLEANRDAYVGGSERQLVPNDSVGWMFGAKSSPDGDRVAVFWQRFNPGPAGLWVISLTDVRQLLVRPDVPTISWYPYAWSSDGQAVISQGNNEIVSLPVDRSDPETILTLPDEPSYYCSPLMAETGPSFVCEEEASATDVWLVENFDPHVN